MLPKDFNNTPALHPFVIYYVDGSGKLAHKSYAKETTRHMTQLQCTVFWNTFMNTLLVTNFQFCTKSSITVMAQQHNKELQSLNEPDISSKWFPHTGWMDFFATSHRKSVCDGSGGTIKRLAAHASLQRPFSNQIIFPKQLFDFAEASVDGTTSSFVSSEEVVSNTEFAKL